MVSWKGSSLWLWTTTDLQVFQKVTSKGYRLMWQRSSWEPHIKVRDRGFIPLCHQDIQILSDNLSWWLKDKVFDNLLGDDIGMELEVKSFPLCLQQNVLEYQFSALQWDWKSCPKCKQGSWIEKVASFPPFLFPYLPATKEKFWV